MPTAPHGCPSAFGLASWPRCLLQTVYVFHRLAVGYMVIYDDLWYTSPSSEVCQILNVHKTPLTQGGQRMPVIQCQCQCFLGRWVSCLPDCQTTNSDHFIWAVAKTPVGWWLVGGLYYPIDWELQQSKNGKSLKTNQYNGMIEGFWTLFICKSLLGTS